MKITAMPRPPYGIYPPEGYVSVHYWAEVNGVPNRLVMDYIHTCRFKGYVKLRGRYYMLANTPSDTFKRKRRA